MNKPVAWMVAEMVFTIEESAIEMAKVYNDDVIPLYTHPAELTDEEIEEVINRTYWVGTEYEIRMKIARAILKKAQEK